jgi:hypothetical protein
VEIGTSAFGSTLREKHLADSLKNCLRRLPFILVIVRSSLKYVRSMADRSRIARLRYRAEVKIDHLYRCSHLFRLCRFV